MGQSSLAVVAVVCRWWVVSMLLRLRRWLWGRGGVYRWFGRVAVLAGGGEGWWWSAVEVVVWRPAWGPVDRPWGRLGRSVDRVLGRFAFLSPVLEPNQTKPNRPKSKENDGIGG
jgi:hypothetical protein